VLWQLLVFGDMPSATTLAGAALIVASTLLVAHRAAQPAAH
jgi:drug/metabolite transporter (DMT)-like permease